MQSPERDQVGHQHDHADLSMGSHPLIDPPREMVGTNLLVELDPFRALPTQGRICEANFLNGVGVATAITTASLLVV